MIEKIVHTAKQTVKARVDIHRAPPWPAGCASSLNCIVPSAEFATRPEISVKGPLRL